MDPQLEEFVGKDANIVRFGKRFRKICVKSAGQAVFYFVYLVPSGTVPEVDSLPENTRLERAMKAHYQSGKVVYEMFGYFFPEVNRKACCSTPFYDDGAQRILTEED